MLFVYIRIYAVSILICTVVKFCVLERTYNCVCETVFEKIASKSSQRPWKIGKSWMNIERAPMLRCMYTGEGRKRTSDNRDFLV